VNFIIYLGRDNLASYRVVKTRSFKEGHHG